MKLLERWDSKQGHVKLVVKHWYGKREYYKHPSSSRWRTSSGRILSYAWPFTLSERLDALLLVRETQYYTQTHVIALDKLDGA